jgi:hypothetical protein
MSGIDTKRAAVFQEIYAAQESLRRLRDLLAAGDGTVDALLLPRAATAGSQIKNAVSVFAFRSEAPEAGRVPCSFCGQAIMSAATLCGFCWRKRTPATP